MYTHAYAHTKYIHTQTYTHTHKHTYTHAYTQTELHTNTHIHECIILYFTGLCRKSRISRKSTMCKIFYFSQKYERWRKGGKVS